MSTNPQFPNNDLEKSIKAMNKLSRSTGLSMLLMICGVIIIIFSFFYSLRKLKPLEDKMQVYENRLDSLDSAYQEKLDALANLENEIEAKQKVIDIVSESNANTKRKYITIEYFFKDIDSVLVLDAIKNLGYNIKAIPPKGNTPTNAIWYGNKVDIEDVQVIAYTLINSGVEVQEIRPFLNPTGREKIIQLGGSPKSVQKSPFTIEQIKSKSR